MIQNADWVKKPKRQLTIYLVPARRLQTNDKFRHNTV